MYAILHSSLILVSKMWVIFESHGFAKQFFHMAQIARKISPKSLHHILHNLIASDLQKVNRI